MSVDGDPDPSDTGIGFDIDEFVSEFSEWYRASGDALNPYDAIDKFIEYYANKQIYLPFAKQKLLVMYVLSGTYIGILSMIIVLFITMVIGSIVNNFGIVWIFTSIVTALVVIHFGMRVVNHKLSKYESDVSIAVINYKQEIDDAVRPNGFLADWINSMTKQRVSDKVEKDDVMSGVAESLDE